MDPSWNFKDINLNITTFTNYLKYISGGFEWIILPNLSLSTIILSYLGLGATKSKKNQILVEQQLTTDNMDNKELIEEILKVLREINEKIDKLFDMENEE